MEGKFKQFLSVIGYSLLSLIIILQLMSILAWYNASSTDHDPSVFGFTKSTVMSGSMEPTIHVGELVVTFKQPSYKVGDIIMVWDPDFNLYILHRIVDCVDGEFITKGDHNTYVDARLRSPEMIVGKCIYHSMILGHISSFVSNPIIAFVIIGLVLFSHIKKE